MNDLTFRAIAQAAGLTTAQVESLARVSDELDRLHEAIRGAVDAGVSVELERSARYHCGGGHWGDLMRPVVVRASARA